MPSVFDGMASTLNSVFGDPVVYLPRSGGARSIRSIFRDAPVEVIDEDGHPVIITSPSWRVRRFDAPDVTDGDEIEAPNGRRYRIRNVSATGSPAVDAMVICELERVYP